MSHRAEKSTGRTLKRAAAAPQANTTSIERRPNSIVARSAAPDQRRSMIAEAAYYLALQRNFEPGHDVEDWLLAESQIDAALPYSKVCF
jgi:hypothetical protein